MASVASLRDLLERLDGAAHRVVRLLGPGAHSLAAEWASHVGAPTTLPLDAALDGTERTAWLDGGPGALVAADSLALRSVLSPGGAGLVLTGSARDGGRPEIGVRCHVDRRPDRDANPTRIALEPATPDAVRTALERGSLATAHAFAEREGSSDAGWLESMRLVMSGRAEQAWHRAWTTRELTRERRWFVMALASFHTPPWARFERLRSLLLGLPADALVRQEFLAFEAARQGRGTSVWLPRDLDAAHAMRQGRHTSLELPDVLMPVQLRRLSAARDAFDAGAYAKARLPPPGAFARWALDAELLRGAVALQRGDAGEVRRVASRLSRVQRDRPDPESIHIALEAQGPDWASWTWLQALATLDGVEQLGLPLRRDVLRRRVQVLGDYLLERPLASGAMGTVWAAEHGPTGTAVAIKVLKGSARALRRQFAEEIDLVSELRHPAIIEILDHGAVTASDASTAIGLEAGSPYLVMERIDGGTLTERVGTLTWSDLSPLVAALLDAVAYAHAHDLLHRDIKPDNVLVLADHSGIRLSDFGLASLPRAGKVAGTPLYMAPEMFAGTASVASDLYAVAATVWHLVCGEPPFEGSFEALASRGPQVPSFDPRIEVPAALESWLATALAYDPAERFDSAADMLAELQGLDPGGSDDFSGAFTLESLLDLERTDNPGEEVLERRHWRPRLPTARLSDDVDAPVIGRASVKSALWSEMTRAVMGRGPCTVELRGPTGSGRRTLARWVLHRARAEGVVDDVVRCLIADGSSPEDFAGPAHKHTLAIWTRPPPSGAASTVLTLERLSDADVFWALRSRVRVAPSLAVEAVDRAVGRVDRALALVRGWLEDPGLVPGPEGLEALGPLPDRNPAVERLWRTSLSRLTDAERRGWRALAVLEGGFVQRAADGLLAELGVPPATLDLVCTARGHLRYMPPELRGLLEDSTPAEERALAFAAAARGANVLPWRRAWYRFRAGDDPKGAALIEEASRTPLQFGLHRLRPDLWRLGLGEVPLPAALRDRLDAVDSATPWSDAERAMRAGRWSVAALLAMWAQRRVGIPWSDAILAQLLRISGRLSGVPAVRSALVRVIAEGLARTGRVEAIPAWADRQAGRGLTPDDLSWALSYMAHVVPPAIGRRLARRAVDVAETPHLVGVARIAEFECAMGADDMEAAQAALAAAREAMPGREIDINEALLACAHGDFARADACAERFAIAVDSGGTRPVGFAVLLGTRIDAPAALWNDLEELARAYPSAALVRALDALADAGESSRPHRAARVRELARASERLHRP